MDLPDEIVCSILDRVIREFNGDSHLHIALVSRQWYRWCVLERSFIVYESYTETSVIPLALRTIMAQSPGRPSAFPLLLDSDPPHPLADLARNSVQHIIVPHYYEDTDRSSFFFALRTCPKLHTLRLFKANWFSIDEPWPASSPGPRVRPHRLYTDADLYTLIRTRGLEVFGDHLTHLLVDHAPVFGGIHPRVRLPKLTHLAVLVPGPRYRTLTTCIEEILACFRHPSSRLELLFLILEGQNNVFKDEFFNSDIPSSLLRKTAPEIVLGSFGLEKARTGNEIGAKLILDDLRKCYFDIQEPYPCYPGFWDRAQVVIDQRHRGSDSG